MTSVVQRRRRVVEQERGVVARAQGIVDEAQQAVDPAGETADRHESTDDVNSRVVDALVTGSLAEAPIGIVAIDAATRSIRAVNRTLAGRLDVDPSEMPGLPFVALVPEEIRANVTEVLDRLVTGQLDAGAVRCRCLLGSEHKGWLGGRLVALRDASGATDLVIGYCDFDHLTPDAPCDAFEWEDAGPAPPVSGTPYLVVTDPHWNIVSTCPGLESVLGRDASHLAGQSLGALVHVDDLADVVATAAEVMTTRVPAAPVRARLRRGDGSHADAIVAVTPMLGPERLETTGLVLAIFTGAKAGGERVEVALRLRDLERSVTRLVEEMESRRTPTVESGAAGRIRLDQLPGLPSLSGREREVLELVAEGYRVSTIARELFVSPSTVRNHLSAIFRKLGVSSQAQLLERLRATAELPDTAG